MRGFTFTLTGPTVPSEALRFHFGNAIGYSYCVEASVQPGQPYTVDLDQLSQECWEAVPGPPLPANAMLSTLTWAIVSNTEAPTPFDFCITDLRVNVD